MSQEDNFWQEVNVIDSILESYQLGCEHFDIFLFE